jgi:phosphatidylglycerophosphate synthase
MATGEDRKADCYSGGERRWMEYTQHVRGEVLGPMLRGMARIGLRPDHLTVLSLLAGLAFCPLYFYSVPWALVALTLHVILDGLDGPLARHLGVASRSGSFTDSMADQTVIAATTLTLMYTGEAGVFSGALYIVAYTVVVLFAMARNALNVPYSWLFRPRFLVYAWILVENYWLPGTLDWVLWACTVLLLGKTVSGFVRIRSRI